MMDQAQITHLGNVVAVLKLVPEESQLLGLQNLCINNGGRWDNSGDLPETKQPCMFEIQLFGVPAMADTRANLPKNWMRAATNIIDHWNAEQEAAA